MKNSIFLPTKIKVGFNPRIDTYSETLQMTAKIHNGIHIEKIKEFKNGEEQ